MKKSALFSFVFFATSLLAEAQSRIDQAPVFDSTHRPVSKKGNRIRFF